MKYLLLYNPVSGKGKIKKKLPFIKEYFNNKNLKLDIYESKAAKDLEEQAEKFASQYDVFIIAGGDGTINEVINGIMKTKYRPAIGVLPSGTANDIAAILGFNKNIKRSLDIITSSNAVKMDVNLLDDRYFIYTTAVGIMTKISYDIPRTKVKKFGYFAYIGEGAKELFKKYRMKLIIEHDQGETQGEFMLVLGLSTNRVGGMFLYRFSRPKLDDGKIELRLLRYRKVFKTLKLVKFFVSGGKKAKNDIHLSSSYFKIKTVKNDVVWNTDGERGCSGDVVIKVLQQEMNVFVSDKSKKRFFSIND